MNIFIGADHRGFTLKQEIIPWLQSQGHTVTDVGNREQDPQDDYVPFAQQVGQEVAKDPSSVRGILLCGSGIGMAVAANKIAGVRAAAIENPTTMKSARNDDDINVLALSADTLSKEDAHSLIETFLTTPFSGEERHVRRIEQIAELENHGA